jgi:hypothetical protein
MKLLTLEDIKTISSELKIHPALIYSVDKVESAGCGYYLEGKWKGELKILFEGHIFHRFTKGIYDTKKPHLSYKIWTKQFYRKGSEEFSRFMEGLALNKEAALLSTSWGRFQIMGFNYKICGYNSVTEMVTAFYSSGEPEQLKAFINFIKNTKVDNISLFEHLKAKRFAKFAQGYNGKSYKKNNYDTKLLEHYRKGITLLS